MKFFVQHMHSADRLSYLLNDLKYGRVHWLVWFLLACRALPRVLARESEKTRCQWTHRRPASEELFCQQSDKCFLIVSLTQMSNNTVCVSSLWPPPAGVGQQQRVSGRQPADAAVIRDVSLSSICVHVIPNNVAPLLLLSPALSGRPVCMQERPMCPPSMDLRQGGRLRRRIWWNTMQWVTGGCFSSHLFNAALQAAAICAAARCCFFFLFFLWPWCKIGQLSEWIEY